MRLLIDGYNLLHATDLFGAGELAGTLRGSREALIAFLADRLTPTERLATVVVFDANDAPPGLPDRFDQDGIDLRFARDYSDADAMIEAILEGFHRAKHLTVVSGDRRVQRAARSSGARWVDSDAWFAELCRRPRGPETDSRKPTEPVGSSADWVAEFSDPAALAEIERQAAEAAPPKPLPARQPPSTAAAKEPDGRPKSGKTRRRRPPLGESTDKPRGDFGAGVFDPFPPGYADDLLDPSDERKTEREG
ncbi:YacP-like NYN domain protein [Botrimarina colliarenosi]|uniref:YacP-like NYN domain protein n=1 Tax=Botrimarina colliarenosi TaxID=2528001 RepID=A0A5C6AJ71_9BACT|nr:NYN domain-containing protein [Botrimarina colliarenosi]TWT99215.1 YacP-like NYN domain protein [Botrimarina colliarenosi]